MKAILAQPGSSQNGHLSSCGYAAALLCGPPLLSTSNLRSRSTDDSNTESSAQTQPLQMPQGRAAQCLWGRLQAPNHRVGRLLRAERRTGPRPRFSSGTLRK